VKKPLLLLQNLRKKRRKKLHLEEECSVLKMAAEITKNFLVMC